MRSNLRGFSEPSTLFVCRCVAASLQSRRATFSTLDIHNPFLHLIAASVADPTFTAMPYPEFVARSSVVANVTAFHPFLRLALWAAYMDQFSIWDGKSAFPLRTSRDIWDTVKEPNGLFDKLVQSYCVVDNPVRFPLLDEVWNLLT